MDRTNIIHVSSIPDIHDGNPHHPKEQKSHGMFPWLITKFKPVVQPDGVQVTRRYLGYSHPAGLEKQKATGLRCTRGWNSKSL